MGSGQIWSTPLPTNTAAAGLLEVCTAAPLSKVGGSLVIDFTSDSMEIRIELNGRPFSADSPSGLADALLETRAEQENQLFAVPYGVTVDATRVVIDPHEPSLGTALRGTQIRHAVAKASRMTLGAEAAWPAADTVDDPAGSLDRLAAGGRWDGPLIVSMPRTGSTLMGILFLFNRTDDGHRFERYIHEPAAPLFWRGDDAEAMARFVDPPLSERDVVQESAYQFAHPEVARWFVSQARSPVIFTMRHPRLAWPSRWRAMLGKMRFEQPDHPEAAAAGEALDADDFSSMGRHLSQSVRPADNGFHAFVALIDHCHSHGIEYVIVDNTRFRGHPDDSVRAMCERLGIPFDPAMTAWSDLAEVRSRVVMSDLATGEEYDWYYAGTLSSSQGIEPESHVPLDRARFPAELLGTSDELLTIDEAELWYQLLLDRPETLA